MEKSATLNLRVNPVLKEQAETILRQLGIPMSTAIDIYLNQIALTGGIPFLVTLPKVPASVNADTMTAEAIHEKLQKGLQDAEDHRVQDARDAFASFRESWQHGSLCGADYGDCFKGYGRTIPVYFPEIEVPHKCNETV